MKTFHSPVAWSLPLLASLLACTPGVPGGDGGIYGTDASTTDAPRGCRAPVVRVQPPGDYPYRIFTVTGTVQSASRVFAMGEGINTAATELERNATDFCLDVIVDANAARTFPVYLVAQCNDGSFSPQTPLMLGYKPGPELSNPAPTCSGSPPTTCVPTQEICTDGIDNDCDGLKDTADTFDCTTCPNDPLEGVPGSSYTNNSPGAAPELAAMSGTYSGLRICPNDLMDCYAFFLHAGDTLQAAITFPGGTGTKDLDLDLIRVNDNTTVANSHTTTTREQVSYMVPAAEGKYAVCVSGQTSAQNTYELSIRYTRGVATGG